MATLTDLPNIGPAVAHQLQEVGIATPEKLAEVGAKDAWLLIQGVDESACIHRLQALEGAIRGVKKSALPAEVRADLKAFYQAHKL